MPFGQHAAFTAWPHGAQWLVASQALKLPVHELPLQQICVLPPHPTQLPLVSQASVGRLQLPEQHGCVLPPHGVQCEVPPVPPTQVRPPLQLVPQHGWLLPPQETQWLVPSQVRFAPVQDEPGQHGSPAFMPQATHVVPLQTLPWQQGVAPVPVEQPAPTARQETQVPGPVGELHACGPFCDWQRVCPMGQQA